MRPQIIDVCIHEAVRSLPIVPASGCRREFSEHEAKQEKATDFSVGILAGAVRMSRSCTHHVHFCVGTVEIAHLGHQALLRESGVDEDVPQLVFSLAGHPQSR